jgi:hypothetical protein
VVVIGNGLVHWFQNNRDGTFAFDKPIRVRIERFANAVRRNNPRI